MGKLEDDLILRSKGPELILHAAVLTEDGYPIMGKHHADCFHKGFAIGKAMAKGGDSQGFITNKGKYVTRSEAAKIAIASGQIDQDTELLFSENMWSDMYKAKNNYDNIKGYVPREGT